MAQEAPRKGKQNPEKSIISPSSAYVGEEEEAAQGRRDSSAANWDSDDLDIFSYCDPRKILSLGKARARETMLTSPRKVLEAL